jgi:hypothetical protein
VFSTILKLYHSKDTYAWGRIGLNSCVWEMLRGFEERDGRGSSQNGKAAAELPHSKDARLPNKQNSIPGRSVPGKNLLFRVNGVTFCWGTKEIELAAEKGWPGMFRF